MGWDKCKNDVRTLFFIFNTFSGVGLGLLMFSSGVSNGVLKEMKAMDIINIVVGLMYIVFALLGYCGAIAENYKMLRSYFVVMFARSVSDVTRLVRWGKLDTTGVGAGPGRVSPEDLFAEMILETIVTMVSMLLALTLGINAKGEDNKQPARAAKALTKA